MNLPRPFTNVFKTKSIYRGSDWIQHFALRIKEGETVTPLDLTGYTVKMTIKPPVNYPTWTTPIVKNFTPTGNEFILSLTSAEQLSGITDFETCDVMKPLKCSIEVMAYNSSEHVILIRDDIMIYSTVRNDV